MALRLQELQQREPMVNEDGTPSQYFLRYLKARGGALTDLEAEIAAKVDKTTQVIAGTGLDGGGPLSGDVTLDANIQDLLDGISSTQGSILYRNASDWVALSPGTSGHFLKTNGAAANPEWAAASGGGSSGRNFFGPTPGKGGGTATWSAGFMGAVSTYLMPGETISRVGFEANAASASTVWKVGLYSDNSGAMDTKLAEASSTTTGVSVGMNEQAFGTAYTNTGGSPIYVWMTLVAITANFTIRTGHSLQTRFYNLGSTTLPTTAAAQTTGTNGWSIYGR